MMEEDRVTAASDQIQVLNFDIEWLNDMVVGVTIMGIVKWMLVVGLVMYSLFALVIIKQVQIMTETFEAEANGVVRIFAWAHLVMAVILVVVAIVIL